MKYMITITGLPYYYGHTPFKKGQKLVLVKEPDNEYDNEAIMVKAKGLGKVGYVANSTYTVQGDCVSAGRLYDKIGDKAVAKVKYILPQGIVCKVKVDSEDPAASDKPSQAADSSANAAATI